MTRIKNSQKTRYYERQIEISDEFYEPISEEELALWYDGPIFPGDETHNDQFGE